MLIHIGENKKNKLTTLCGKPVARRWWVLNRRFDVILPQGWTIKAFPNKEANCKLCLFAFKG